MKIALKVMAIRWRLLRLRRKRWRLLGGEAGFGGFDLMLPGMDGLFCDSDYQGREDELKSMPIIVLTAKDKE